MPNLQQLMRRFLRLDVDRNGVVDVDDFKNQQGSGDVGREEIEDFIDRFDRNDDGMVTLEEFSRAFSVNVDEMKKIRDSILAEETGNFADGSQRVELNEAGTGMPRPMANEIIQLFLDTVDVLGEKDLNAVFIGLKKDLAKRYPGKWHLFGSTGQFIGQFDHGPFMSVQFNYNKQGILIWRS